jgi:CheY-like chemotaxis protein
MSPEIVVVDDDFATREMVTLALEQEGHNVTAFESGREGLRYLAYHPESELLISNLKMPGMSGAEMVRRLRRIEQCRDIPAVLLTAEADYNLAKVEDLDELFLGVIKKPFDLHEFLEEINGYLQSKP